MDKQQARNLIKTTFEQPFDKVRFISFVKNLLNSYDETKAFSKPLSGQYIRESYRDFINSFDRIGRYCNGDTAVDILIVHLNRDASVERARTAQRNFIAGYLKGDYGSTSQKDAALVAFVSPDENDWRFSLVRMDYKFEQTPTGKMRVKEEFTPARRWSFLVGANENSHTAQSRLVNILANDEESPTLAELEEAFNIETVTKEFFLKYRDLFIRAKEALDKVVNNDPKISVDFTAKGVNTVDFAKKLLGQITFLYFLQKKGWFGVQRDAAWGTGSKQFLRELFDKKHGNYNNFFDDILEPLFYEALRIDRSHDDDYYSRFNCKIPFLNGGLFDPIGSYDWVHTDIHLPDGLFSNKNKTKEGDDGDGILDIFNRYNFTVKEDEPLEKEVAIDPELLGKAYEKFNAIRPDNFEEYRKALKSGKKGEESKFNKQYGVYYTPREIVHYMCRQSLINYLHTEVIAASSQAGIQPPIKEDIEVLIHTGEQVSENEARVVREGRETKTYSYQLPECIRQNAECIDRKLAEITMCDPAVGSGAFPVGMMSEIVKARTVLTNFIATEEYRTPYVFKRRCIEHSLYGVDIDHGAVEIAKLRLWLSLVVDEDDIKNIKPLPNLDYKIVCGNSLLGLPENAMKDLHLESEIERLKIEYFNETNPTNKKQLNNKIDQAFKKLVQSAKEFSSKILDTDFDFKIHFSEVFHEKDGFDCVIANPPYVRQESIRPLKPHLEKAFGTFYCGTADIYTYFYKCGIDLLKPGGHLCFIAPNKFMRAGYGKNTRVLLTTRVTPKLVIDFGDLPIFDATTYPSILLVEKNLSSPPFGKGGTGGIFLAATFTDPSQLERLEETLSDIAFPMPVTALREEGWNLERPEVLALMDKLRASGIPLGEYVQGRFYRGVLTGFNEAFVIDAATREKLIAEDPVSAELIKPWLRGRDIRKWKAQWSGLYVIFTRRGTDIEKYPAIKRHLLQFRKDLEPKKSEKDKHGRKPGTYKWYEIQDNIAYYEEFEKTKIIIPAITENVAYAVDENAFYSNDKTSICVSNDSEFLCGLLNSNVLWWFIRHRAATRQGGFYEFKPMYVCDLPIPHASNAQKAPIIERTRAILTNPDNPATPRLEAEIDKLIYALYDLTPGDIAMLEALKP